MSLATAVSSAIARARALPSNNPFAVGQGIQRSNNPFAVVGPSVHEAAPKPRVVEVIDLDGVDDVDGVDNVVVVNKVLVEEVGMEEVFDDQNMCPVCFDPMTASRKVVIGGCGHELCGACVNTIRKRSDIKDDEGLGITLVKCPMCRGMETLTMDLLKQRVHYLNKIRDGFNRKLAAETKKMEILQKKYDVLDKNMRAIRDAATSSVLARNRGGIGEVHDIVVEDVSAAERDAREFEAREREAVERSRIRRELEARLQRDRERERVRAERDLLNGRCCGLRCVSTRRTSRKCAGACGRFCCARCRKCVDCRVV